MRVLFLSFEFAFSCYFLTNHCMKVTGLNLSRILDVTQEYLVSFCPGNRLFNLKACLIDKSINKRFHISYGSFEPVFSSNLILFDSKKIFPWIFEKKVLFSGTWSRKIIFMLTFFLDMNMSVLCLGINLNYSENLCASLINISNVTMMTSSNIYHIHIISVIIGWNVGSIKGKSETYPCIPVHLHDVCRYLPSDSLCFI